MSNIKLCRDCKQEFDIEGDMKFLNALKEEGKIQEIHEPARCKPCRQTRKQNINSRDSQNHKAGYGVREYQGDGFRNDEFKGY